MSKADVLRLPEYLGHIVQAIDRIHRYVDDMTQPSFLLDEKTQDAVIRNFEIMGKRRTTSGVTTRTSLPATLRCR